MASVGTRRNLRRFKKRGRAWGTALLRAVFTALAFLAWLRGDRRQDPATGEIKKILLIRLDLLGDVILTMPAVAALRWRYPKAHMAMLVLPYTAPALDLFPYVDQVLTFDINKLRPSGDMLNPVHYRDLWRLLRKLRRERCDLSISFYGLYAGLLAFLSGARLRIGYRGEGCPFLYNLPVPGRRYLVRQHEVEYNLDLARAAGARGPWDPLRAAIPVGAQERVEALLDQEGIGPGDVVVALHPGAANDPAKRWPAPGWARLADRLVRGMGARVALTGVASELPLVGEVVGQMSTRPVILAGKTSFAEMASLLARCRALVAGDSAPLHLAWALGVPVVALHGPTDPAISGPYGGRAVVLRKEALCPPCYDLSDTAECSRGDLLCMKALTSEEVYAAVERVLQAPAPAVPGTTTQ